MVESLGFILGCRYNNMTPLGFLLTNTHNYLICFLPLGMKSIQIFNGGGFENLKTVEQDVPKPGVAQVLVKWHATSLNFHDYLVGIGGIKVPDGRVPMSDGAGEVVEVGEDVSELKVGDKVMGLFFPGWITGAPTPKIISEISGESLDGFMTEYALAAANSLTKIPNGYSYAEAATLPTAALTAWNGLFETGSIESGQSVLIEGTGGMSIFGLQLAKAAGAKIFATTSSEKKAERLKSMGVEEVVNYKTDERWGKTIFKRSNGGVHNVLDVGGGSTMNQSIEAARMGADIIAIGILSGGRKGSITFPKIFFKFLNIRGIAVGSKKMQEDMVNFINNKGIKPIIDKSFGFDELQQAFEYQASGKHFGKIVLEW